MSRFSSAAIGLFTAFAITSASFCERPTIATPPTTWGIGTSSRDVQVGDEGRSYLVHVPKLRRRNVVRRVSAFPLLILLHGSGAGGETVRRQSNFDSLADLYRVVTVYPDGSSGLFGIGSDWNAGECCGAASRGNVDDVSFIEAVIADVSHHLPIDPRRIYIAGFSDGGRMAYHFACVRAPKVAAIGVISGSLVDARCRPTMPVPVAVVHGTADAEVSYLEPARTTLPYAFELGPLPPSVRFWAVVDGCTGLSANVIAPTVTKTFFRSCRGADVLFYSINGGTHSWPGGLRDGSDGAQPASSLNASAALMRFFLSHSR